MWTVQNGEVILRRFAKEISAANPEVATIGDVTPEVWWGWRSAIESRNRWPSQINAARSLLHEVEGLPGTTRRAMNARASKPKRTYNAYSRDEFKRIRSAAWRTVAAASARIETNVEVLVRHQAGEAQAEPQLVQTRSETWSRGAFLEHLSLTGRPPDIRALPTETARQVRSVLGVAPSRSTKQALFLTSAEVYAFMILFACEHGYNASVIGSMTVGGSRADDQVIDDPVYVVDLDKPRRGPQGRFFSNTFTGGPAKLWEKAVLLTQPARDTLAALGHPTDNLLIAVKLGGRSTHPTHLFKTDWPGLGNSAANAWHRSAGIIGDDCHPLRVTLRRLRLTEQVLNEKSSHNTQAVSESVYRFPDPQTHAKAREVVLQGQVDALEHALATVHMRTVARSELAAARTDPTSLARKLGVEPYKVALLVQGRLDTATGACLDYENSPFEASPGKSCRASFLSCLACPNAVATQDHLPRLIVLHDTLIELSDVVSRKEWQVHYAEHLARLQELLTHYVSDAEVAEARSSVSNSDRQTIENLLRGRFDR